MLHINETITDITEWNDKIVALVKTTRVISSSTDSCRNIHIYWIHTDAMNNKRSNKRRRKTSLTKYLPLTLFVRVQRVTQSLRVRGSWRPNITEIFNPKVIAVSVMSFSVFRAAQPDPWSPLCWVLAFLTTSRPPPAPTLLACSLLKCLFCSIRRPYNTFKLPRGDMHTPLQFLPISGNRDVSLPLSLEWPVWSSSSGNNCHAVQRSLPSGASVYKSIMGFFFTSSHFISQFPPTRFPLITAIRTCRFLPVRHREWHFWPGQKVTT